MENKKLKVYYAHFMGLYNTPQEKRDIELLERLGFEVINPNTKETSEAYQTANLLINADGESYEKAFDAVFGRLVRLCDVLAYKPLPDGRISGGVGLEIGFAKRAGVSIIALPNESDFVSKIMSGDETRAYLRDMGVR